MPVDIHHGKEGLCVSLRAWVATTQHAGGDYATIPLIRNGKDTPELDALRAALNDDMPSFVAKHAPRPVEVPDGFY